MQKLENKGFGSKHQEYLRTIEVLKEIKSRHKTSNTQIYFMLIFLIDSAYNIEDIKKILSLMEEDVRADLKH